MKQNQKILEVTGIKQGWRIPRCAQRWGAGGRRTWLCQGHMALDTMCWARAVEAEVQGSSRRDVVHSVTSLLSWVMLGYGRFCLFSLSL